MNTVSQQQKKLVSEKQPNFLGTGMSRRDFLGAGAMVTGSIVLSGKAFSMLKSNTTDKSKGSLAWKKMVQFARQFKDVFERIYHARSQIEGVNSALKRRYGNFVRAIKRKTRNISLALRVLAYNIKQLLYDRTARHLGVSFWIECDQ